jgi:DNA-binding winged helix-turn-helix (wHTH) protein/lipoprotein NlpI
VFEFYDFRLDAGKRLLFQSGQPVALAPKAFDILLYLVHHHDRVVTKAELLKAIWPDTFVEEANLAQNVSVIRRALGESPSEHKSILTIPGRGYRFAADVREQPAAPGPNAQAYQLFLKGRHFLNKRLTSTLGEAITMFLHSTDEDPTYAPAWVGLADAYALLSLYGASMPRDVFPKSKAAAMTALRLDPALAEAHNSLGVVELFYERNWSEAERSLRRAIELNPDYGDAHQRYGIYLTAMGRFDEAQAALDRAQTLDPLSRISATIAGYPAYYSRNFDAAVRQFRHVLQLDPGFSMAHFRLGLALAQQGRHQAAIEELTISRGLSNDRDVVAAIGLVHAMMGDRTLADAAIAELHERSRDTFVSPYTMATIHAALGDADQAFEWLGRALVDRSYWVIYLNVDPALDVLRADPRFDALRRQAHLHEERR